MENRKAFKTPGKTLARMQAVHLGKILFNLQFIVLAVMLASVVSFVLPLFYYLFLVFLALFSFFSLFANPTFRAAWSGGEALGNVAAALAYSWKYTVPIIAVLAITSIVCLCFDKNKKHVARIVISVLICVAALIILIFKLLNSGAFA